MRQHRSVSPFDLEYHLPLGFLRLRIVFSNVSMMRTAKKTLAEATRATEILKDVPRCSTAR